MKEKYAVKCESLRVPMRDGVELSTHVYRPDAAGKFPAILSYIPYRKGPLQKSSYIAEHGYVFVYFDIRGTGDSGGWNDSVYSPAERQDGYDMVEWAAAQPWCSGKVGMYGISYGAVVSLQTAMAAPPHLKAIIARSGSDDPFTEWTNPGGSLRPYMYENYSPLMTALNLSPPDPEAVGEKWTDIWQERLEKNLPWGISFLENIENGEFWRERSLRGKYDRVKCAVFVVGGWADWYPTPLLRIFNNLKTPKRGLIGPWSHRFPGDAVPGPQIEWDDEFFRWFDFWLKGIDNKIMKEPPLTIFVREHKKPASFFETDNGKFRCENEWPPARSENIPFYFGPGFALSRKQPEVSEKLSGDVLAYCPETGISTGMHGGGPGNDNWTLPLDQRLDDAGSLAYTSEILEADTEITGLPCAELFFSSSARNTTFCIKLCAVAPDGSVALVSKGFLNAAYREYPSEPAFLEPGKIYKISLELQACAYCFKKGHRLRIMIANSDFLNLWPSPEACTNTLYRNTACPSKIILPLTLPRKGKFPAPSVKIKKDSVSREMLPRLDFSVSRDIVDETTTFKYKVQYGPMMSNDSEYCVSSKEPAKVSVRSRAECKFNYLGQEIKITALTVTASDQAAFHHQVKADVKINDEIHFTQKWSRSVPRKYS